MNLKSVKDSLNPAKAGAEMYSLVAELYPICRSITGDGVRKTLQIIKTHIPLEINEIPTGTKVFDWTIPKEWNIQDAYISRVNGEKVVDFNVCNLHVLNYSTPVKKRVPLAELKEHIFTLPEHPDWVPYRTSYYNENWGFCLSQNQLTQLTDDEYDVCIDTSLEDGQLTYGEFYHQGETDDEVLLSAHVCHPSLCNDNLSGISLLTYLAKSLSGVETRYSYRLLFIPGTIGAITWLSLHEQLLEKIKHGLVVACVGDKGRLTYKKSRLGDAEIDRAVIYTLKHSGQEYDIREFTPYGYDERQFCSPGINLPVGSLTRTPYGEFPQYHTSADSLDLVRPESLAGSLSIYLSVLHIIEANRTYVNQNPKCEPQLGKRGLYDAIGGTQNSEAAQMAMLWVLNLSDGSYTLLDIAERAGIDFDAISRIAAILLSHNLMQLSK